MRGLFMVLCSEIKLLHNRIKISLQYNEQHRKSNESAQNGWIDLVLKYLNVNPRNIMGCWQNSLSVSLMVMIWSIKFYKK